MLLWHLARQGKLSFWHKSFMPLQSHSHGSALKALSISALVLIILSKTQDVKALITKLHTPCLNT